MPTKFEIMTNGFSLSWRTAAALYLQSLDMPKMAQREAKPGRPDSGPAQQCRRCRRGPLVIWSKYINPVRQSSFLDLKQALGLNNKFEINHIFMLIKKHIIFQKYYKRFVYTVGSHKGVIIYTIYKEWFEKRHL